MKPNKQMRRSIAEWKAKPIAPKCYACGGSGYYDIKGSPKCGSCSGTGLSTVKGCK
jgi:DnaJ-class molecular chaperone